MTAKDILEIEQAGNAKRHIYAANDGGSWKFGVSSEPMAFENVKQYEATKIRERFVPEILGEYLSNFGIHLFSSEFYETVLPAQLILKEGFVPKGSKEYFLEDANC